MMTSFSKNSALPILVFLSLVFWGCQEQTESTPTEEVDTSSVVIAQLSGYEKIDLSNSVATYNGRSHDVTDFNDPKESNNILRLTLSNEDTLYFFVRPVADEPVFGGIARGYIGGVADYNASEYAHKKISELKYELTAELVSASENETLEVTVLFNLGLSGKGSSKLSISGNVATITGSLGKNIFNQILDLNKDHSEVNTLLLRDIPGSGDDEYTIKASRLVREAGYTTWVDSQSEIYSGGVDFFCAGKRRIINEGAILGVHSWCCGPNEEDGADLPKDDASHNLYIDFYEDMFGDRDLAEEFYFFTLRVAPSNGIHEMSREEIAKYQLAAQ